VRRLFGGLSIAILAASVAVPVAATPPPDHKVTICHALPDKASHDYNVISVDIASSGYVKGGHYVAPGDSSKHADGGDIIPPYVYVRKDGTTFTFTGQNYAGNEFLAYELGCGPEVDDGGGDPET
jgi:hypothetical protein